MKSSECGGGAGWTVSYRAAVLAVVGLSLQTSATAREMEGRPLSGHVPAAVSHLKSIGRVSNSQRMDLAIALPLRDSAGLTRLLEELYDPASPQYRQFLSPAEFTERFGPTSEEYEAVTAFVRSNGFKVTGSHPNRVLLDVNGAVADIERTFHLEMHLYKHPTEARMFYAPSSEPVIDGPVSILGISGLDNYTLPRPLVQKTTRSRPPRPLGGSGPGGSFLGKDFRAAYVPGIAATGAGQAVGLLEFDGYYASDITAYESLANLPNIPLTNVLLDNFNGNPGGANDEVALDIEMAMSMAPGLTQIVIYEAGMKGLPNDILNRMATDNLAKQLSSSWAWSGGPDSTTDQIFQQLAAQGQSFFQASGDSGAYSGSINQTSEPSDNPYITVVGGTTLNTSGPGGTWVSETTWSWFPFGMTNASSGGISTTYSLPTWQQGISMSSNHGSTTMRNIPDVALTADNIWVTYNNGSSGAFGGTSCAAPLWAGLTALINQQALGNGRSAVGFLNPALYALAATNYASVFHDITTGNNTNLISTTNFFATSGYDLCTGLGTPVGAALVNVLGGPTTPKIVSNSVALVVESCPNGAVDPGETVTVNFGLANVGSANTTNLVATLQPGSGVSSPSSPQTYGAVSAGGNAITKSFTFTAVGACGGTVTAVLQLQDGASNLGTVSLALPLGAMVTAPVLTENFDELIAPAMPASWTNIPIAGTQTGWITTNGFADSTPNSAFAVDATVAGLEELLSPAIQISSATAQLTFRHNYNLAAHTSSHPSRPTTYYDGGVLQISIGGGPFTDILAAGGTFVSGGYNCTLASGTSNPLNGQQAWGGNSGGWITTTVALPASAAGQSIVLGWGCGTAASSYTGVGWFVDSISLLDSHVSCCSPDADLNMTQHTSLNPAVAGQNLSYSLTVANLGPTTASSITVTDTLPASVSFVSASAGFVNLGGAVAWNVASLAGGATNNFTVTVIPSVEGPLTNMATVVSVTADPNLANNSATNVTMVDTLPTITMQPSNQVVVAGGNVSFQATAAGTAPLSYHWTFNASPIPGATSSTLLLNAIQSNQAGNYAVVVTNMAGSVTSAVATLQVIVPPHISSQPVSQSITVGGNGSFQVTASGTAPLTYQWLFNGTNAVGTSTNTLVMSNVQTTQAGDYSVVVTNVAGAVTSLVATLTVGSPPTVVQEPVSLVVTQGQNANFTVTGSGDAPLGYQWRFNGTNLGGATTTSLTISGTTSTNVGSYDAVLTNPYGSATSSVAQLTVLIPPWITGQPSNQVVIAGGNANFQVVASGTAPLGYQWLFNATNAVGASTNMLLLNNVQPAWAGNYNVVLTNVAGAVTSAVVTLTVGVPPTLVQQPASLAVTQGQDAVFTVTGSGDAPLGYQWRFNGTNLGGATATSLKISGATSANAGNYDVVLTNPYGSTNSTVAQLMVLVPPLITGQPSNQVVIVGGNMSFQVAASGTAPLGYQWLFNATNVIGSNTNSLALSNAQPAQAGNYSVLVTNVAGAVTSVVATLTVGVPPTVVQQPASLVVAQDQSAVFTVIGSGDGPLGYQWRFNGANLNGATVSGLTVSAATSANAGSYDVVLTNLYGSTTSSVAQLTVLVPPLIASQPSNQVVIVGGNVSFQIAASGTAPLGYEWLFNATNVVGSSNNTLVLSNAQPAQAGNYSVVVTNVAGAVTSAVATLTVGVPPTVAQQPASLVVTQGQNAVFAVSVSGDAPLNYQWRFNGTNLGGATATSLTVSGATSANVGNYDVVLTNPYGSTTSSVAQLTVLMPPLIIGQPTNQTVLAGGMTSFQVDASGTAPLGYQWLFNTTNVVGSSTNTLVLSNAQPAQAGNYSVVVTNVAGAVTSALATLTIGVPPTVAQQPASLVVTQGQNAVFTVTGSGDQPLSYQWRFNGANLGSATSSNLTVSGATPVNAGNYYAVLTNPYGSTTSSVAQLTVLVPPLLVGQPTNQTVMAGGIASFRVAASGTAPLGYQWLFNATSVVGSSTNTLVLSNAQPAQAGNYTVVVTNVAGAVTSIAAILTICVPPTVVQQPTSLVVTQGQNAVFTVTGSGDQPLSYQWRFNGANLGSATSSNLTVSGATPVNAGNYYAVLTNPYGSTTSSVAKLTVLVPPLIVSQPSNQIAVAGGNATFQVTASGTALLSYQWLFNGTNAVGTSTNTLVLNNVQSPEAGNYSVVVTNISGAITSVVATLTVGVPPPIVTNISLAGTTVSISINTVLGLDYYLEYKDNIDDSSWTAITPGVAGIGAIVVIMDTNAVVARRFYRVRGQ